MLLENVDHDFPWVIDSREVEYIRKVIFSWQKAKVTSASSLVFSMSQTIDFDEDTDDECLVLAVCSGHNNAYSILVRRYETILRGYCARMIGDFSEGEDAAQEVFLRAFRSLRSFRSEASFKSWLFRIAHNYCIDYLRKARLSRLFSFRAHIQTDEVSTQIDIAEKQSADDILMTREALNQALAALPDKQRSLLLMHVLHGFSYAELAESSGKSIDSVKSLLKRARQCVKDKANYD